MIQFNCHQSSITRLGPREEPSLHRPHAVRAEDRPGRLRTVQGRCKPSYAVPGPSQNSARRVGGAGGACVDCRFPPSPTLPLPLPLPPYGRPGGLREGGIMREGSTLGVRSIPPCPPSEMCRLSGVIRSPCLPSPSFLLLLLSPLPPSPPLCPLTSGVAALSAGRSAGKIVTKARTQILNRCVMRKEKKYTICRQVLRKVQTFISFNPYHHTCETLA